ncbi:Putative cryptochrome DASH,mitochondrial [Taphrina deformans PYCC 5710]|uniref:Cryptochrome DASH n=1 Tax=Taphrina deformans (strain PYCC 5710 / ATCC 11124 / CBS 356.35 / IMI 108563 / JCM 9778 / NBRC 8474) TaxID=1097556 RepID=R4X8R0_TAPDE|nr:Putative cryptochrome DASH,mitochondrial [Taphrina deformans PYCC 5710]|eukprot:CCG81785.1 Putative cryptochrome DASH,mitochondrial [Taphrina deformans PYCC 5710]
MGKTLLYYHKHDLRLHDNPVLQKLRDEGPYDHFLPVYVFPPHQMELSPLLKSSVTKNPHKGGDVRGEFGAWRTGNMRVQYLCETIWDLKQNYKKLGSDLVLKAGKAEDVLPTLLKALKAEGQDEIDLWLQDEYTTEEIDEFRKIREATKDLATFKKVEDNTLVSIHDLPYDPHTKLPNFYTEFRKSVEPLHHVRECFKTPESLPPRPAFKDFENDYDVPEDMNECITKLCKPLGGVPTFPGNTAHPMKGGETAALKRLDHYVSGGKQAPAAHYKETRNQMLGADFSTKFSSFLSLGAISPKLIHHRITRFEEEHRLTGDVNTYWIRFELLWRDYFKFVALKHGKHLFLRTGLKQKPIHDTWLGADSTEARRWKEGTTGVGIVDAAMRELNQTGYMSNRTRQIVASFLTKDLYVDWRIGAEHFEEKLLDHDAASNWGNWQYQAGVGNDPRGSRRFNPAKQTHDYDAEGEYIKTWCPEVRDVREKMGFTYFWTINEKTLHQLNLSDLPGVKSPIKGLCADERTRVNGKGGKGFRGGKARRDAGRPRRTGPSDKFAQQNDGDY